MVHVVFLGVGGWISDPSLGYTSILVESSSGERLLFDAGEGVYAMLRRCGYSVGDVDYVVVTHAHGDHVLGLPTLVQMRIHDGLGKLRIITFREAAEDVRMLIKIACNINVEDFVEVIELKPFVELNVGAFKLSFIEARHTVPAVSAKLFVDGKCLVYSGDTAYNPDLVKFAKKCSLLIHEAANYSEDAYKYGHSSYYDAMRVAVEADVEMLALVHFYQKPMPVETKCVSSRPLKIFIPYPCMFLDI